MPLFVNIKVFIMEIEIAWFFFGMCYTDLKMTSTGFCAPRVILLPP